MLFRCCGISNMTTRYRLSHRRFFRTDEEARACSNANARRPASVICICFLPFCSTNLTNPFCARRPAVVFARYLMRYPLCSAMRPAAMRRGNASALTATIPAPAITPSTAFCRLSFFLRFLALSSNFPTTLSIRHGVRIGMRGCAQREVAGKRERVQWKHERGVGKKY